MNNVGQPSADLVSLSHKQATTKLNVTNTVNGSRQALPQTGQEKSNYVPLGLASATLSALLLAASKKKNERK